MTKSFTANLRFDAKKLISIQQNSSSPSTGATALLEALSSKEASQEENSKETPSAKDTNNTSEDATGGSPIKIQAIQTNPNTATKQIVAFPIHSSEASSESRKRPDIDFDAFTDDKRRKTEEV